MSKKPKPRFTVRPRDRNVSPDSVWRVWRGDLRRRPGRPRRSLFRVVAEKLPYDSIKDVERSMKQHGLPRTGVYVAHDAKGTARYIGRGRIFPRLKTHHRKRPLVLQYFSFYVILDKSHEREVETLLIRAAGPLLEFNQKKKRVTLSAGSIRDYEAGTVYFQRHHRRQSSKSKSGSKSGSKKRPV